MAVYKTCNQQNAMLNHKKNTKKLQNKKFSFKNIEIKSLNIFLHKISIFSASFLSVCTLMGLDRYTHKIEFSQECKVKCNEFSRFADQNTKRDLNSYYNQQILLLILLLRA